MAQTQGVVISELENPQKSVIITHMRDVLLSYADSFNFTELEKKAYCLWVAKLRRGLDSFFPRSKRGNLIPIEGKEFKVIVDGITYITQDFRVIDKEEALTRFNDYMSKCEKNGVNPLAEVKAGRKPKNNGVA